MSWQLGSIEKNATATVTKEVVATEKSTGKNDQTGETVPKSSPGKTPIAKKLAKKNPPKKVLKKPSLAMKLKAKAKKTVKMTPKLTKSLLQNTKTLENRKKLLKNGVKEVKPRKRKAAIKKEKDDSPPVLEPIFPIEENLDSKKQPKKRVSKKAQASSDLMDVKKIKVENDDSLSVASDVTDISAEIPNLPKQIRKPRAQKKIKAENDSLEDVMNDLSFLIKEGDIKKENDTLSESGKSDTGGKPKKLTKRQRIELLKKQIIKKEDIENTLGKLDSSDEKVIDMLDLPVRKVKKKSPIMKRRHSIEKFPIGPIDTAEAIPTLSLFTHLPRSISPRSKRNATVRQSVDSNRRASPYTRSDSPVRMLRNGKQRKLKDLVLFEGLDTGIRKRRRLCSDLSGSEMSVSRSGYESDSSFSDMASLPGGENNDSKDLDTKLIPKEAFETEPDTLIPAAVKRSSSSDTATNGPSNITHVDTNSNLCDDLNPVDMNLNDKAVKVEQVEQDTAFVNPSVKVPEKSIILDIMKQTFNDVNEDKTVKKVNQIPVLEAQTVVPSIFYGTSTISEDENASVHDELEPIPVVTENLVDKPSNEHKEKTAEPEDINFQHDNKELIEEQTKPSLEVTSEEKTDDVDKTNVVAEGDMLENVVEDNNEKTDETAPEEAVCQETIPEKPLDDLMEEVVEESVDKSGDMPELIDETTVVTNAEEVTEDNKLETSDVNVTDSSDMAVAETVEEMVGPSIEESAEELAEKENILKALGLQSLSAAEKAKQQKTKDKPAPKPDKDIYTGTLKTVIKINRDKKKGRNSLKMTLQKNKSKSSECELGVSEENNYKIMKDKDAGPSAWKQGSQSSDTAGAHRKSHYSNRSNLDGSSEHTSDGESAGQDGAIKALVIPEKASSFSIHPDRLCKDECSYCFGKFGLFDTPCHIAQMKSVDRQNKILAIEKHLTRDSCLCDACYRHIDRKANIPSYTNKSLKRNSLVAPGPRQNHCHVLGCNKVSSNILRRKWIIKMRKSICQAINIDLDNPGLHSIPICDEHYSALEHLMVCAMCKRRLARNHIHYLGPETNDLNNALNDEDIPLTLTDKPVVCKLCKCFASIILKDPEERPENSASFFKEYKRRLLHFNDIVPMDEAAAEEPISVPSKADKLDQIKKKTKKPTKANSLSESNSQERMPSTETNSQSQSRSESPSDEYNNVDYNTLIPAIAMDCGSDTESKHELRKPPIVIKKDNAQNEYSFVLQVYRFLYLLQMRDAVEISKIIRPNDKRSSDVVVAKLGSNPSISVRQLFPGEEEIPLMSNIEFHNVKDRTPEGWEKCVSTIQYDNETKRLWQELQKPYGNQSSFLRHLILLEKYFRNGDLVLSSNASHHSINYSESVHNRLRAYDNIPTSAGNIQPISMIPFNKMQKSCSGIITSTNAIMSNPNIPLNHSPAVSVTTIPNNGQKSTPLTISQLNSPPLIPSNPALQQMRPKIGAPPPGLISLHPGTNRPVAPLVKMPQSQKIKFPITKNWRPNLIPIDPTKKQEKKQGLVQVISGGKPYHITLEDYKKMCAIKRSFEMKQKRLQEAQNAKPILVTHNSVLKSIIPRKGLIISKTATITSPIKSEVPVSIAPNDSNGENENILDKLDRQVEKLEAKLNEKPSSLLLPKIPKSLTVIPQTVTRKPSRPSSPVLLITPKNPVKS
ncbi:hypothetical protein NQ317_006029 [Molorchus minor]|uniref:Uncharacterized protein n=1 Tax=Molorchus minor TaxID=1323400 RepID=A0ABQ9K3A3_9CUCU|nr:hypothetical protein NQ317_006029 [Molorchus minor]